MTWTGTIIPMSSRHYAYGAYWSVMFSLHRPLGPYGAVKPGLGRQRGAKERKKIVQRIPPKAEVQKTITRDLHSKSQALSTSFKALQIGIRRFARTSVTIVLGNTAASCSSIDNACDDVTMTCRLLQLVKSQTTSKLLQTSCEKGVMIRFSRTFVSVEAGLYRTSN